MHPERKILPPALGEVRNWASGNNFSCLPNRRKGSFPRKAWGGLSADLPKIPSGHSTGAGICSISVRCWQPGQREAARLSPRRAFWSLYSAGFLLSGRF